MLHSASPGRRAVRALLVPVSGLALLAGVLPASAATAPAVSRVHSLRGLPSLPGFAELPGFRGAPSATTASVTVAGTTTVKTANGQSWTLSVGDSNSAGGLVIALVRTVSTGGTGAEEHLWQFKSKASSLTFSKTTGDGTIKGGSSTGKVATVSLTLKSTSHKAGTCSSGSETIYTSTLSGEAELVTGLTGGGTVGGKPVTLKAEAIVDSDCVVSTNDCLASILFDSGTSAGPVQAVGLSEPAAGKTFDFVSVIKELALTSPKGATRTDIALVQAPLATWNPKTGVLSVTSTSAGIVTGSATLSGGTSKTSNFPCTFAGKKYTIKDTDNFTAKYASPAGKALTGHTSLGGELVAPSSAKDAEFIVSTVS
jgi:hypothetical protein